MNNQHPITPPPELVEQWTDMLSHRSDHDVFALAARWGADQELEACCTWLSDHGYIAADPELRAARRPKPPSLKKQALDELTSAERLYPADWSTIRKALEALPMTNLSPAAQVVLDAYKNAPDLMLDGDPDEVERCLGLAAALRAAVSVTQMRQYGDCWICDAYELLTIANELEVLPND